MTADVEIKTATKDSVLFVPIQSVVVRTAEDLKPAVKGKRKPSPGDAKADETAPASAPGNSKAKKSEEIRGVFVIVDGKAEFRRVKPGIASDTDFEVVGELKPGEKVVIGPHKTLRTLKPGQKVKIEEPKKPKGKEQS
jgi:HlyD family secretion protein